MDEATVNRVYDQEIVNRLADAQWKGFDVGIREPHPFYHLCRKCMGLTKTIMVAMVVEAITFYPTHLIFHELGWL